MTNLDVYYSQQAGTGIAFYPGVRYQKGHGFFGRFFQRSLLPLIKSLGHKLLSTGVDVADDVINNDLDPMSSLRRRGKAVVKDTASNWISSARKKLDETKQDGTGKRKRKRKGKSIKAARKPKKRVISKKVSARKTSKSSSRKISKKKSPKRKRAAPKKKSTKEKIPKYLGC